MSLSIVFLLIFLIGIVAGLRAMTAPAAVTIGAHLGWLHLDGTPLSFLATKWALLIFAVLAIVELITDQLPKTPPRTAPPGLIARFLLGGLSGAALALSAGQSAYVGALLAGIGGIAGAFLGYQARTRTVKALNAPDFIIAILEDAVAIASALLIVSRF